MNGFERLLRDIDRPELIGEGVTPDVINAIADGYVGTNGAHPRHADPVLLDLSWQPTDLGPVLRGEHTPAEPVVGLYRSDGLALLYPGKEHSVIGEMESGKSWFCAGSAAAELERESDVLYVHFEEADPLDTVNRLLALGVPAALITEHLSFVGPDTAARPGSLDPLVAAAPVLVILDGVNEAMSLHGWKIREEDGAAEYRRQLVKPFTAIGAAVLSADHVVKDRQQRGRDALGSIHKGNGLTGSLILLENAEPFGRGVRGRSHVFVTKDRPGALRRHGRPSQLPGKTFIGELVVDDTREHDDALRLTLWAPNPDRDDDLAAAEQDERRADEQLVLSAVADLIARGKVANLRALRGTLAISHGRVDDALERLLMNDELAEETGQRRARIFTLGVACDGDC